MDPVSHAASGAILALSLKHRPQTRYFVPLAALVAASPDIDVIFSPAPIDFLLLHRGITHSIFAIPFLAPLLALLLFTYWRKTTTACWSYFKTCLFVGILLLLHIWLDIITTYGTMIFLPFSDYRVRLNGVFIIDFLLLIPMISAVILGFKHKKIAVLCLMWIFIYPSTCVALRIWHEHTAMRRLAHQDISNIAVLPDAFAPFYWRLIYEDDIAFDPASPQKYNLQSNSVMGEPRPEYIFPSTPKSVHHQGLDFLGQPRTKTLSYPALEQSIALSLRQSSKRANAYLDFCLMPIEQVRKINDYEEYYISDLRFGTMLPFVQSIMKFRKNGEPPFILLAKRKQEKWTAVRLVFGGSGKDSEWKKPIAPKQPTWWQWLIGTY